MAVLIIQQLPFVLFITRPKRVPRIHFDLHYCYCFVTITKCDWSFLLTTKLIEMKKVCLVIRTWQIGSFSIQVQP